MNKKSNFKRILLKLSGENLMGKEKYGIDYESCRTTAKSLKKMITEGLEVAVVIGGGNIFRGINLRQAEIAETPADHMGMLATLMNGVALSQALEIEGCKAKVLTALDCPRVAESYTWQKAHQYLEDGFVVIFVGGTGNPYFTTDTASALRASEIHADILLKATKVNGIFDKDPLKYPDATKFDTLTYTQALQKELKIMDATAFALCMNNSIPIFVFNMERLHTLSINEIVSDKKHGTIVTKE